MNNEIKMNTDIKPEIKKEEIKKESRTPSLFSKLTSTFIFVVIGMVVIFVGIAFYSKIKNMILPSNGFAYSANSYYAFFLTNGQVYFGKIISQNSEEIMIEESYYLQPSTVASAKDRDSGSQFTLIKTKDQIYGPTDQMILNKTHLLFYQELDKSSKVTESILKAKTSN